MADLVVAQSNLLAVLNRAREAVAEAQSLDELKAIRDQAEAARHYVKAARMGKDMADRCADIRLRAERKAGQILRESVQAGNPQFSHHERIGLADLGVSHNQSHRWQRIAAIPEEHFEGYLTTACDDEKDITAVGLIQYAARQREPDTIDEPIPPKDGTYRCIVIDPPWPMRKIERVERPNQGIQLDYPVLTLEQIADETIVPVRAHADDDCHLYLWAYRIGDLPKQFVIARCIPQPTGTLF